jgi:DNA-3-methyladenine glycosylase II
LNNSILLVNQTSQIAYDMISFVLKPTPPFRLDLTAWTLRRRPENAFDRWEAGVYRRVLPVGETSVLMEVRQLPSIDAPRLSVHLYSEQESPELRPAATKALERLLGLRLNLQTFYDFAAHEPKLGALAARFRGMKPPRFLSGFECLANAIACQQFSLAAGIQILNRFCSAFGVPFDTGADRQFAFPRPQDICESDPAELMQLGFSRQKAKALLELARAIQAGEFNMNSLHSLPAENCMEQLCRLHGIGRWSAEYALLRGLGRLQIFPGDDVGAVNNLKRWLDLTEDLNYDRVQQVLSRWQPFAGLLYMHLLLENIASRGNVRPSNAI